MYEQGGRPPVVVTLWTPKPSRCPVTCNEALDRRQIGHCAGAHRHALAFGQADVVAPLGLHARQQRLVIGRQVYVDRTERLDTLRAGAKAVGGQLPGRVRATPGRSGSIFSAAPRRAAGKRRATRPARPPPVRPSAPIGQRPLGRIGQRLAPGQAAERQAGARPARRARPGDSPQTRAVRRPAECRLEGRPAAGLQKCGRPGETPQRPSHPVSAKQGALFSIKAIIPPGVALAKSGVGGMRFKLGARCIACLSTGAAGTRERNGSRPVGSGGASVQSKDAAFGTMIAPHPIRRTGCGPSLRMLRYFLPITLKYTGVGALSLTGLPNRRYALGIRCKQRCPTWW